jgi:hypothetical protein
MKRLLIALMAVAMFASAAWGQSWLGIWRGSSGGGSATPSGCTNQLVFDYSNSCALIAQPWGE